MLTRFLLPTVLLASTALAPAEEENPLGSKEPFRIRMAEEQVRNPYLRVSLIKCSGNVARWTTALATWPGTCVPIPTGCSAGPLGYYGKNPEPYSDEPWVALLE